MTRETSFYKGLRFSSTVQSGAAMVESILILSLMVVLLTAIPSIAKRQDVRQTTVDANRYATWEMTVAMDTDRELIIDRFYSAPDAPIRSVQAEQDDNIFWQNQNTPLLRDHAFIAATAPRPVSSQQRNGNSLVDSRSIKLDVFERAADTGSVADIITGTIRTVSDWTGSSNAIAPNRGIVQAVLSVGDGNRGLNEDGLPQECSEANENSIDCLSIGSAILVDGWEAATDEETEEGAQAMVPTQLLDPLGNMLDAISLVPLLKEFEDMDDSFGCVNTSLLPTKELTGTLETTVGVPNEC